MTVKRVANGEWGYPPVVAALESQVVCHPIYYICTKLDQRPGMRRVMKWWDQDVVHKYEEKTENLF